MWKEIEGFGGAFEVSSEGYIRSNLGRGIILKAQNDKKGYQRVRVTYKREKITFKVHREVAKAFIPNPLNYPQVNHIDGDKNNNSVTNLEWVSNADNARHAMQNGLWVNVLLASFNENNSRKIPIYSVDCLTGEKHQFCSVSEAERFFGTRHISDVLKGKRDQTKGQTFHKGVIGQHGMEYKADN